MLGMDDVPLVSHSSAIVWYLEREKELMYAQGCKLQITSTNLLQRLRLRSRSWRHGKIDGGSQKA